MRVWMGPIWWIRFGFGRGESDGGGGGGRRVVVVIDLVEEEKDLVEFSFMSEVVEDVAEWCRRC